MNAVNVSLQWVRCGEGLLAIRALERLCRGLRVFHFFVLPQRLPETETHAAFRASERLFAGICKTGESRHGNGFEIRRTLTNTHMYGQTQVSAELLRAFRAREGMFVPVDELKSGENVRIGRINRFRDRHYHMSFQGTALREASAANFANERLFAVVGRYVLRQAGESLERLRAFVANVFRVDIRVSVGAVNVQIVLGSTFRLAYFTFDRLREQNGAVLRVESIDVVLQVVPSEEVLAAVLALVRFILGMLSFRVPLQHFSLPEVFAAYRAFEGPFAGVWGTKVHFQLKGFEKGAK